MATHKLHWISALTFGLCFATGCPKEDSSDEGNDSNNDTGGSESSTAGTMSASSTNASATMTTMSSDSMSSTTDTMTTDTGTITDTGESSDTAVEPQPNGSMCEGNEECESGFCFVVGILGGLCGECNTDADCAATTGGGCSIPNPLANPPQGAHCNMGEAGAGCMTSDVCEDPLQCAEILNVPGVLVASTCSECLTDADCMGDLCSPTYDVLNLSGQLSCVPAGSVADGLGCDFMGTGDDACMSGHCAIADVMGLLQLGVCSACEADEDCMPMETCEAPAVDLMAGLIAGSCVPA
ncbi:MAG TPA: hypothetical protein VG755_20380 [Nannocystaceae bacterium]|nr:hypothetical protein [Nannocystaceae bacterium]